MSDSKKVIHCIGDSHVSFFSGEDKVQPLWPEKSTDKIPLFKTYRIGAVLAYSLSKYNTKLKGREIVSVLLDRGIPEEQRSIAPKSNVLFCFGEIDCRAHFMKQSEMQGRPVDEIVEDCVEGYVDFIKGYHQLGYNILIWGPIPSAVDGVKNNEEFPFYGTNEERNRITKKFNESLKIKLSSINVPLVSIFESLVNEKGLTNPIYYRDSIHLSQRAMPLALSEFEKLGLS